MRPPARRRRPRSFPNTIPSRQTMAETRPPIRFRGRSFVAMVLAPTKDVSEWLADLDGLSRRAPAFFSGRPMLLDVAGLGLGRAELEGLVGELSARGIRLLGIEGAAPDALGPGLPPALTGAIYSGAARGLNQFLNNAETKVLVEGRANSRVAILNRPSVLNALTTSMAARLNRLYESWEENSEIGFVMMKGGQRAFCSGTDVVTLYRLLNEGKTEECKLHFDNLYKFVYVLGTYLKPHVAIMNGIVMGGGAGISLPGMFRVVTEKTVFASPEVQIGFHPDAGASYYLSRLPGYLGEYLALTGEKLNGTEMMACGLATHYSLKEKLSWIEERLGKLITDDRSIIENSLAQYGSLVYPDERSLIHRLETIDKYFCHDTLEEIVEALENRVAGSYDEWSSTVLGKIKEASPLSLKVTLRSIREGRFQTLDQCLAREYRISLRWISKKVSNDFSEGVRARLVDKDFGPKWDPSKLEEVTADMVQSFFFPLGEVEPELNLPTAIREPDV